MLRKIEETVRQYIAKEQLLSADALHLVALSGGADSVALLLILKRLGYTVEAVHCNFHLRGEESNRDEIFVRELCEKVEVKLHLIHFDTVAYAELHQVSIEMAARQLRYRYFEQLRQDIGAKEVCVAHHRDDAVETLLMNLVRGTGIHGLTGIRPRNGHVVRPLLCLSREQIVSYLEGIGQPFVTDSTNLVPDVVRNKLRLQVIPLLQEINPAVAENIAKTASHLSEVEQLYDQAIQQSMDKVFDGKAIEIAALMKETSPESVLYELLTPRGFMPSQVEQVFSALTGPSGRTFSSATHDAVVDRGRLLIEAHREPLPVLRIPEEGTYRHADSGRLRVSVSNEVHVSKEAYCATLDADKVVFPLTLRPVQKGDRFQPFGMKGSRLVSDFLTDQKCSLIDKKRQLVVTDREGCIVWLVGMRTDQRFAVDSSTNQVLIVSYEAPNGGNT